MKSGLFREHQAKDCQEIEELRRICCEEIDRARQAKIDELSMHQESNPTTVSQLLTQIQDLQNKANSLSRPQSTLVYSESQRMLCRESGLPRNTRNIMGTSGNVFERPPTRKEQTSTLFNNSKNLASSSPKLGLKEISRSQRVK